MVLPLRYPHAGMERRPRRLRHFRFRPEPLKPKGTIRPLTPSLVSGSNGKVAAMPRINVGQPESRRVFLGLQTIVHAFLRESLSARPLGKRDDHVERRSVHVMRTCPAPCAKL